MKPTAGGSGFCEGQPQTPEPGVVPYTVVACRNMTIEALAQQLRQIANAYLDRPVTDQTGLKGAWDFDIKWTPRAQLALAGSDGISLNDALEKQLGLRLEPKDISQPVIIVDSVNRRPTPNPSGLADNLPSPPPAEFDVASIKLSPPGTNPNPVGRIQPGGRIDIQNFPLRLLLSIAWDITNDAQLVAPKFVDETLVSIAARTSETALGNTHCSSTSTM
jgi:hypothetical protein